MFEIWYQELYISVPSSRFTIVGPERYVDKRKIVLGKIGPFSPYRRLNAAIARVERVGPMYAQQLLYKRAEHTCTTITIAIKPIEPRSPHTPPSQDPLLVKRKNIQESDAGGVWRSLCVVGKG